MKFGNYECYSVEMGRFSLDGGPIFGVVPKALWEKKINTVITEAFEKYLSA